MDFNDNGLAARLTPLRARGRPAAAHPKAPMARRVDADVLAAIKASGSGWQTRVNVLLREAVRRGPACGQQGWVSGWTAFATRRQARRWPWRRGGGRMPIMGKPELLQELDIVR